jgi:hypothetical protein
MKEVALMRRVTLVVLVAVTVAAMIAFTVGSALANPDPGKVTYIQKLSGVQYNAVPPSAATGGVGTSQFRGTVFGDLRGAMDATLYYTGRPDENVTTEIIGGTWILCSAFTAPPRDPETGALIEPQCTDTSAIKLTGTWRGGTAKWDEGAGYALVGPPGGPQVEVYAGVAGVKATLGVTAGTVNGVSVKGGSGKFEGTLDHRPLAADRQSPPTVSGDMTLKF